MKKIFYYAIGLLLILFLILIITRLLGYSFNKEYFIEISSYHKQKCVEDEYPTYYHHSGIAGCIFWMREDYLQKKQSWREQFKKDDEYCDEKYDLQNVPAESRLKISLQELDDPKCEYEAFRTQKRNENWNYLVSKEKDGMYDYCVEKICPRPKLFK